MTCVWVDDGMPAAKQPNTAEDRSSKRWECAGRDTVEKQNVGSFEGVSAYALALLKETPSRQLFFSFPYYKNDVTRISVAVLCGVLCTVPVLPLPLYLALTSLLEKRQFFVRRLFHRCFHHSREATQVIGIAEARKEYCNVTRSIRVTVCERISLRLPAQHRWSLPRKGSVRGLGKQ